MSKFIAYLALISATYGISVINYWYVFGLWPKSWLVFAGCLAAQVTIALLYEIVKKEDE